MSDDNIEYFGKCELCKEVVKKRQMTRHLKNHFKNDTVTGGRDVEMYHLIIEDKYAPMYWMHVEVPGVLTLEMLDAFLRNIWLECCGHLSCFTIDSQRYASHPIEEMMFSLEEDDMNVKIEDVLDAKTKFQHEYDYGSTTELNLRVAGIRETKVKKHAVKLLARNQPPEWKCAECGKPATLVEPKGWVVNDESVFCDDCATDEEYCLPIVNSPRTGVCGYCG